MNQDEIRNNRCWKKTTSPDGKSNPKIVNAVKKLIQAIGDNPLREGLKRTPIRVARAYSEWFGGYEKKPEDVLNRTFPSEGYDDMVVIRNIQYASHCEHHLCPFSGIAHIGIIYGDKITGLDKFPKLVEIFARRLQTQEVMTKQIGDAIKKVLNPKGIFIVITGKHLCVSSRETKQGELEFITTYRDGTFKDDKTLESRFLQYIKG